MAFDFRALRYFVAVAEVAPDATFEAQGPASVPIYGRFQGHGGVRRFIAALRELFDTERFDARQSTQSDGLAFAYGYMQHRVRKTGRVFRSEWLYCEVRDDLGRLLLPSAGGRRLLEQARVGAAELGMSALTKRGPAAPA